MIADSDIQVIKKTQDFLISYAEKTAIISLNNSNAVTIIATTLHNLQLKILENDETELNDQQSAFDEIKSIHKNINESLSSSLETSKELLKLVREYNAFVDNIQEGKKNG